MASDDKMLEQAEVSGDVDNQEVELEEAATTTTEETPLPAAQTEVDSDDPAESEPVEVEPEPPVSEAPEETHSVEEPTAEELFLAAMSGDFEMEDALLNPLKKGQIVDGTIASVSNTEILVDVGAKSEGVIAGREFDALDADVLAEMTVGQDITVYVLTPEDREGNILLSLRRAMEVQDWKNAVAHLESGEMIECKVVGYNKGGLLVSFGRIRGFVPASQLSEDRRRRANGATPGDRWGGMVGEQINVKTIEVDRGKNRLIMSERAAYSEIMSARKDEVLDNLEVGQVITGRTVRLTNFGAFIDIGGIDGLVHLSELAWEHVAHPKDVLKVGEQVDVEVINIDKERGRVGLSRKKCQEDPWRVVAREYDEGQLVQGVVTKLTNFGAFARLVDNPAIEGLLHISELVERRVKHPGEVVSEGDVLTLRIIRIEPDKRRLGLSLKQVESEEYMDNDWQSMLEQVSGGHTSDDDAPADDEPDEN